MHHGHGHPRNPRVGRGRGRCAPLARRRLWLIPPPVLALVLVLPLLLLLGRRLLLLSQPHRRRRDKGARQLNLILHILLLLLLDPPLPQDAALVQDGQAGGRHAEGDAELEPPPPPVELLEVLQLHNLQLGLVVRHRLVAHKHPVIDEVVVLDAELAQINRLVGDAAGGGARRRRRRRGGAAGSQRRRRHKADGGCPAGAGLCRCQCRCRCRRRCRRRGAHPRPVDRRRHRCRRPTGRWPTARRGGSHGRPRPPADARQEAAARGHVAAEHRRRGGGAEVEDAGAPAAAAAAAAAGRASASGPPAVARTVAPRAPRRASHTRGGRAAPSFKPGGVRKAAIVAARPAAPVKEGGAGGGTRPTNYRTMREVEECGNRGGKQEEEKRTVVPRQGGEHTAHLDVCHVLVFHVFITAPFSHGAPPAVQAHAQRRHRHPGRGKGTDATRAEGVDGPSDGRPRDCPPSGRGAASRCGSHDGAPPRPSAVDGAIGCDGGARRKQLGSLTGGGPHTGPPPPTPPTRGRLWGDRARPAVATRRQRRPATPN
ncbi:hypothetical protein BU14_2081s0001, partial [Porphyra umbilicalis]